MAQARTSSVAASAPNDLEAFFMPFTANRAFKARPRLIARAKDMHYYTPDGRAVLDLYAGTGALGLEAISRGAARAPFPGVKSGGASAAGGSSMMTI